MEQSTGASPPSTTPIPPPLAPADQLRHAIDWALRENLFASLTLHGNSSFAAAQLVLLALFWVWSEVQTLSGAFADAHRLAAPWIGKHALLTFSGFSRALANHTEKLLPLVLKSLHRRIVQTGGVHLRVGQWFPLAVDGTRVTTPRTRSNELAFNSKRYGKGARAKSRASWKNKKRRQRKKPHPVKPQIWLTMLWHMGLKLPWAWKTGPSNSSERKHFADMVKSLKFEADTLFCADAGFVGYDLWKGILDGGHHVLIRVGKNVRLLRGLEGVGRTRTCGDLVHFWPNDPMRRGDPPLALRLLSFKLGKRMVYAVTSVLDDRRMSGDDAVKLYRMRWGVEVQFRAFKQTFGRGELHSRRSECAVAELEWSLLGLTLIQAAAAESLIESDTDPERVSVSLAVAVFRAVMRGEAVALKAKLRYAVKDDYKRTKPKKGRYRKKTKDLPAAGRPKVTRSTKAQQAAYKRLAANR